ncbi:MAG: hypothetical protein ACKUBY_05655 [Candidatus Moraniibacteriota bacterium]|jgi:Type IV secretion system pilin
MKKQKYLVNSFILIAIFFIAGIQPYICYGAGSSTGSGGSATFKNPVGYNDVNSLLAAVGTAVQGIVAALAVLMIVVGGIIYITSAGDQGRVELAKKAVTSALIGLALALAAPAFLYEIYNVLGATQPSATSGSKTLSQIIIATIKFLSGLVGSLSVLMLLVGGMMYMTSGGDSTKADTAKNIIKYAIIGLVVALIALIIVTQVINLF